MAAASLRVRHHGLGMVGYVLSRAGAEWLLKAALPLEDKAIDQVRRFGLKLRHNIERFMLSQMHTPGAFWLTSDWGLRHRSSRTWSGIAWRDGRRSGQCW